MSVPFHLAIKSNKYPTMWMNIKCVMLSGILWEDYANICVSIHPLRVIEVARMSRKEFGEKKPKQSKNS